MSQAQLSYLISGLLNPENARAMLLQFVSAHVRDCFMKGEVRQGETQERKTHDKWRHPHARTKYDCLKTHLDDEHHWVTTDTHFTIPEQVCLLLESFTRSRRDYNNLAVLALAWLRVPRLLARLFSRTPARHTFATHASTHTDT